MGGDDRVSGRVKFPERFDPDDPLADNYERKKEITTLVAFIIVILLFSTIRRSIISIIIIIIELSDFAGSKFCCYVDRLVRRQIVNNHV